MMMDNLSSTNNTTPEKDAMGSDIKLLVNSTNDQEVMIIKMRLQEAFNLMS